MADYTSPDFGSIALITIDTQIDVLQGQPLEIAGTSEILPQMRQLAETFRRAALPIVHVVRLYKSDGSNVDRCRRSIVEEGSCILRPGTNGAELAPPLRPEQTTKLDTDLLLNGKFQSLGPSEWAMYKPRWGAFFQTPLEQHLRDLEINSIVFTGCNFPNCPRTSIYEASERDFRTVLAEDAVSGLYERGKDELLTIGVVVMRTEGVVQAVSMAAADQGSLMRS